VPNGNSRLVYSTDGGRVRTAPLPAARKPAAAKQQRATVPDDGVVRIRREKKGRGGRVVTTIAGLPANEAELDALLKVLKQLCGAGGSREGRVLEIQGDHREPLQAKLEALGHRVKFAGG
jgi:translation initiation factor 1